ncbi:retrovirus-related Pol polyprotein from transposon TNT 1-94 [Trifolium pratense]|uniref:Retrovirus-related Pol polyprotein from transposon TNT 1-94 n=1 Tax=Trifolium pratense TaxID=57577 RepID=A0A2K3LZI7_TRIPR|nr:retrovirus-related Pol polyprotein from transposon TNT 1-94 [Trifolium pratense]
MYAKIVIPIIFFPFLAMLARSSANQWQNHPSCNLLYPNSMVIMMSMLMENLRRSKEYWSLIEDGVVVAPANATAKQRKTNDESKLKDLKAKKYLFEAITSIWISMRQKYQGSTKVKRAQLQALRRELEILAMKETESVDAYFSRTLTIANKMTAHGETMDQIKV